MSREQPAAVPHASILDAAQLQTAGMLHLFMWCDAHVEPRPPGGRFAIATLARVPTCILLCVVFPLFLFGQRLIYAWVPNPTFERVDRRLANAVFTTTACFNGPALGGMMSGGILADRLCWLARRSRLALLTAGFLLCGLCLYVLENSATLGLTRVGVVEVGFRTGNLSPAAFETARADMRASLVRILNFGGSLSSGLASYVGDHWRRTVDMEQPLPSPYSSALGSRCR